jgi:hypothetical protein
MIDPLPTGSVGANEDDCTGLAVQLLGNPLLDFLVAALRDGFPVVVGTRSVPLNGAHVSDL